MPPRKRSTSTAAGKSAAKSPAVEVDTFGRFSVAAPTDRAELAVLYGQLITVSRIRVTFLGDLLADDYKARGMNALRRVTYTATESGSEPSGEVPTALVRLEMEERRTLERLLVKAAELGIDMRNAEAREREAAARVSAVLAFAELAGHDQADPEVRRWAQRALVASADPRRT